MLSFAWVYIYIFENIVAVVAFWNLRVKSGTGNRTFISKSLVIASNPKSYTLQIVFFFLAAGSRFVYTMSILSNNNFQIVEIHKSYCASSYWYG